MFLWNIAVTSLAEVWIEIEDEALEELVAVVTSLAEVWIEISKIGLCRKNLFGHFPCGSVD